LSKNAASAISGHAIAETHGADLTGRRKILLKRQLVKLKCGENEFL
jgi:hypothetical protein